MSDADEIVKGLTEAQKNLLLALDPVKYRDWKALCRDVRTRNKLAKLGLVWFDDSRAVTLFFMRRLSPLGKAVRAKLQEDG